MKKIISILLTLVMLIGMVATAFADEGQKSYPQNFWDVSKDHWAFQSIAELVDRGVIAGYTDGSFKPDNTVTRAEWAKIMVLAAGLQPGDNNVYFTDMANHWANIYINSAKDYLAAYTDGSFRPDQAAVREDVTVSMVKLKGYDVNNVDYSYITQFSDMNSVSNDLKKYVAAAVANGLINGFEDNTFRGQATLTRAEAATLLWRAFQYGSNNKVVDAPTEPVPAPATTVTTPTPTQAPAQTATPKPEPTQEATPEPAVTPEPTPEPTPTPTPRPYKIDTLVKAEIENPNFEITFDEEETLYYVEDNSVYRININNKTAECVISRDDFIIDDETKTLSDFTIESICYDTYRDELLIAGLYESINSAQPESEDYLYSWKDGMLNILTDDLNPPHKDGYYPYYEQIAYVLSNGNFLTAYLIVDGERFESLDAYIHSSGDVCVVKEIDGTLCYVEMPDVEIRKQYYGEMDELYLSEEAEFVRYNFSGTAETWPINKAIQSAGITENEVIVSTADGILYKYNHKGKQLEEISIADCEVKDMISEISGRGKIFVSSNDDVILYDAYRNTIRILSENN